MASVHGYLAKIRFLISLRVQLTQSNCRVARDTYGSELDWLVNPVSHSVWPCMGTGYHLASFYHSGGTQISVQLAS